MVSSRSPKPSELELVYLYPRKWWAGYPSSEISLGFFQSEFEAQLYSCLDILERGHLTTAISKFNLCYKFISQARYRVKSRLRLLHFDSIPSSTIRLLNYQGINYNREVADETLSIIRDFIKSGKTQ